MMCGAQTLLCYNIAPGRHREALGVPYMRLQKPQHYPILASSTSAFATACRSSGPPRKA